MNPVVKLRIVLVMLLAFSLYSFRIYTDSVSDRTMTPTEAKGKLVWQKYNCNSCHQVYGLGGYLGPDLTNVRARRSPAFIKGLVKNGTGAMPAFSMTEEEMALLTGYLEYLNSTGSADPRTFKINPDGTICQ